MTNTPGLADIRRQYARGHLELGMLGDDPLLALNAWLSEAMASGEPEPTAISLSSIGKSGPSSRIVLLKEVNAEGLIFFTNYDSRKGQEIDGDPRVAALLFWPLLERQVRIEGIASRSSAELSDSYFNSRPRASRISAMASPQSSALESRKWLEAEAARIGEQYTGKPLPRPSNWGGFIIRPERLEFWQGRPDRLHDRILFTRTPEAWESIRLAP